MESEVVERAIIVQRWVDYKCRVPKKITRLNFPGVGSMKKKRTGARTTADSSEPGGSLNKADSGSPFGDIAWHSLENLPQYSECGHF